MLNVSKVTMLQCRRSLGLQLVTGVGSVSKFDERLNVFASRVRHFTDAPFLMAAALLFRLSPFAASCVV